MLTPRSEQSVTAHDGKIYLLGGYPGTRIPSDVVQIYDTQARRWEMGPPLPMELHHAMSAWVDGVLYLIGGEFQGAGTGLPSISMNTVFALDPAVGEWVARAAMPRGRSGGGAAVVDGKIYVAGGRPPQGNDFAVYDPRADTWTVLPDVPTDRNHVSVAAIDGIVYVAGGRHGGSYQSERTAAMEAYDPRTNQWSTRAPLPAPQAGSATAVVNGCMFVIGGEGEYGDVRGLSVANLAYDPRTDSWITLAPMPTPTHGLVGGAVVNGRIHLPGGSVAQGTATASSIHWTYRPSITCEGPLTPMSG
jgi:N-acetylneuraminic acid mutarotase